MVAAVTSSPGAASAAYGSGAARSSTAGLEAQLVRYQKELADCVNCDSSKTPEGKAQIETISNKISEVRSRIDEIGNAKSTASSPNINAGSGAAGAAPGQENKSETGPTASQRPNDSTVGSIVNLYA